MLWMIRHRDLCLLWDDVRIEQTFSESWELIEFDQTPELAEEKR